MEVTRPAPERPTRARSDAGTPVLLIAFNRPDKTRRLISVLRGERPRRVFVAADGPRPDHPDDAARCAETRRLVEEIDWECELRTQFQDHNLGCKLGPETAITWFFSQVPEGIILEDDCLPEPDFFPFCAELLERFRDTGDVMMITGRNSLGAWPQAGASYLFSRSSPTWGWATWRRAWREYDSEMAAWATAEARRAVRARMMPAEFRMARRRFDSVRIGELDAWDFAWSFAMLRSGGLSVVPAHNMIRNVGFDAEATHTRNPWIADTRVPTGPTPFPLRHPPSTRPHGAYERALYRHRFPLARRVMTVLPPTLSRRIRALAHRVLALVARPPVQEEADRVD